MKVASSPPVLSVEHEEGLLRLRVQLQRLPDPRVQGRVLYPLDEVVFIALCAMICDQDSFTDMEVFGQSQLDWLRTFLPLKHGAPTHDVFRNVFMALKNESLLEVLRACCGQLAGRHVAIDGKAMRGTAEPGAALPAVQVLRAWVSEVGLSAGHLMCREKSNELEALPRLLQSLELKGAVVSIDAMGGHPHIATQLQEAGADYVLALKGNEKNAFESVQGYFQPHDVAELAQGAQAIQSSHEARGHHVHQSTENAHGRFERREVVVCSNLDWFARCWKWPALRSVVRVRRWRTQGSQQTAQPVPETHYYLSSLPPEASRLGEIIRQHWSIENQCHYILDVTFHEDHCQVRQRLCAHNLSILREMALKVLKAHPSKMSVRAKRKRAALDVLYRTEILSLLNSTFSS